MHTSASLSRRAIIWRSGLSAALYLGLSVPVLLVGVFALSGLVPLSHAMEAVVPVILLVVLLAGFCAAGALWGRSLARLTGAPNARRVAWASGLAFGPLTLTALLVLGQVEQIFVERHLVRGAPIHVVFAIAFSVAAFAVSAGVALAGGWAARGWRFGLQSALWAGLAGGAAFLLADVAQDALGRRVGGPGAEATATMLTVAFLGNIIAAFAAGGVMGWRMPAPSAAAQPALAQAVEAKA